MRRRRLRARAAPRGAVGPHVEVGAKEVTDREAEAECVVTMTPEACAQLVAGTPKGDPIESREDRGTHGRQANARPPALLSPDRA